MFLRKQASGLCHDMEGRRMGNEGKGFHPISKKISQHKNGGAVSTLGDEFFREKEIPISRNFTRFQPLQHQKRYPNRR